MGLISIKMLILHSPSASQAHGGAPARGDRREIIRLKDAGNTSSEIAIRLRIGRASVYRILAGQNAGDQKAACANSASMQPKKETNRDWNRN
jgi:DNA invertase Pin-like site-specific DNA recombinase